MWEAAPSRQSVLFHILVPNRRSLKLDPIRKGTTPSDLDLGRVAEMASSPREVL